MFSVIIPYYNKSAYILRCVDSVMNQTFTRHEIIVVDDGSTDNGIELISKKYGENIVVLSQKNKGVSISRNAGIRLAKHEYIAFLDADDAWHPQYLESVNFVISTEKEVKIVGSHYSRVTDLFDKKYGRTPYLKFGNYFKEAIKNTYFTSSSSVIKKKFFDENAGFNPSLKKGEDHDVWFRVIQSGGNAFYISNTLVYYSDEDNIQATKTKTPLENDLVGNINVLYKDIRVLKSDKEFNRFISLYVYFNLYPYYFDRESNVRARRILKENEDTFFLLQLPYLIPFSIGERLVKSRSYSRFLRCYLKFIIRYILK